MVTFSGKIGRGSYALAWLATFAVVFGGAVVATLLSSQPSEAAKVGALITYGITVLAMFAIVLSASVRRLRDIGWPVWLVLLQFVPLLNLAFMATLLAVPGKPEHMTPATPAPV